MVLFEVRPQKEDLNRTCITVSGIRICYKGDIGMPTGYLDLVKLIINSVLSRRNARFFFFDLKIFISKPQWIDLSMCAKNYQTFHKNSLSNIISHNWSIIYGFIFRFSGVAMAYRSQEGSPMTCCVCILRRRDTTSQPQHLVSGAINGAPYNFS